MTFNLFLPTPDGEARLLLLINAFSPGDNASLEGRTKLAKLDFFLRYPEYLKRALAARDAADDWPLTTEPSKTIESRMIRFRYGPWDPAYFALLGRLVGRGLIAVVPIKRGLGYRTTPHGKELAERLAKTDVWSDTHKLTKVLKRRLNLSGTNLKKFVYKHFPEVSAAKWGKPI